MNSNISKQESSSLELSSQEERMMDQITRKNKLMRRKLESSDAPSHRKSSSSSSRRVPVRVYVKDAPEVNELRKKLMDMEKLQSMYKERIDELENQVCNFSVSTSSIPETPLYKLSIQPDSPNISSIPSSSNVSDSSDPSNSCSSEEATNTVVSPVPSNIAIPTDYARLSFRSSHSERTKLLALYDYVPQPDHKGRLSFKEGDVLLLVSMKSRSGWWHAELNGQTGKIPSNYVEQLDPSRAFKVRVIKNFDATQVGDMTIERGSQITILKRQDNGWYLGQKGMKTGFFPSSCVERVSTPAS